MEDLKIQQTEAVVELVELGEDELEAVAGGFFNYTQIQLTQLNLNVGPSLYTTQSNAAAIVVG